MPGYPPVAFEAITTRELDRVGCANTVQLARCFTVGERTALLGVILTYPHVLDTQRLFHDGTPPHLPATARAAQLRRDDDPDARLIRRARFARRGERRPGPGNFTRAAVALRDLGVKVRTALSTGRAHTAGIDPQELPPQQTPAASQGPRTPRPPA
ncbi:MAG: hypothetical protein HOQ05_06685 [Corynebacteriales bacterium]|nr:hypothetical protein [Mycobacteriales bacterium]